MPVETKTNQFAAVMLSLASSRFTLPAQFGFLGTNALGVLLVTVYNAKTPDLYPGNAHHRIGWIITWVVSAHVVVSLVGRIAKAVRGHRESSSVPTEEQAFMPVATGDTEPQFQPQRLMGGYRLSDDGGQSSEQTSSSLRSDSVSTHIGDDEEFPGSHKEYDDEREQDDEDLEFPEISTSAPRYTGRWAVKVSKVASGRLWRFVHFGYKVVDRIILPFGFIAFTTGIVTYGRFFVSLSISTLRPCF